MKHDRPRMSGADKRREAPRRRFLLASATILAAVAWAWPAAAHAVGASIDVALIDRDTAAALAMVPYRGRTYVAGRPGARYAIRITNRTGERVLAVMSVDGVNIVTGQTADWNQGGYVLAPWQSYDIAGWRKSDQEVAAFEFTSLPDSYAARTGRPNDVGVIGVAVFNERVARPLPAAPPVVNRFESERSDAGAGRAAGQASPEKATAEQRASADAAAGAMAAEPADRLGTGHGARERSYASSTTFLRSSSRPSELVSIQYDRWENLVRAGVIAQVGLANPRPFPKSPRDSGFVPDPPLR